MSDVWDLTKKENGDHVLLALTPEECTVLIELLEIEDHVILERVREELERCLRDQKGVEVGD